MAKIVSDSQSGLHPEMCGESVSRPTPAMKPHDASVMGRTSKLRVRIAQFRL
jgi:hypothetical protein